MILTVTLNAALDVSYDVEALVPGASHRVQRVHRRAGGKGINVARILRVFGHEVLVTGLAGGGTGDVLRADLEAAGLAESMVPIAAESRRTVSVVSRQMGDATLFNEPGPAVTGAEWERVLEMVARLAASARVVVLSGSLPPGIPVDAYARLVRVAKASGAATIVDADGAALAEAVTAGPDVVKPNAAELEVATGIEDPRRAADWLREQGAASVVATFGPAGLVAHTPGGSWRAWLASGVTAANPTGAGDACTAAVAAGLAQDRSWPEMVVDAVAWSAAAVMAPVAGEVDPDTQSRIRPLVRVEELDAARVDR